MTEPMLLGLVGTTGFIIGIMAENLFISERAARRDPVCPTCLGPTDSDGVWEAREER